MVGMNLALGSVWWGWLLFVDYGRSYKNYYGGWDDLRTYFSMTLRRPQQISLDSNTIKALEFILYRLYEDTVFFCWYVRIIIYIYFYIYIYTPIHPPFFVRFSISSSKVFKRSTWISKVFNRIFFLGVQAKANYNVEVFSASNAEKYELLGHPSGFESWVSLGCDIGGAKELGVIYFPTRFWELKSPRIFQITG